MKKFRICLLILLITICLGLLVGIVYYNLMLRPMSSSSEEVSILITEGDTYSNLGKKLKDNGLIRSQMCYKLYIKFNMPDNELHLGEYLVNKNMSVKELVKTFSGGSNYDPNALRVTFNEGKNMRFIASAIAANTNNTEEDVYLLLNDDVYLNEIISEYWFITEEIKNSELYYSLEGYLYPDTYEFKDKDITVKEIFKIMLDNTEKKLEPLKEKIQSNNYTFHELLTVASIVELEGLNDRDRAKIAGVFYNRLSIGMALGSDVTTYYAERIDDMSSTDLTIAQLNDHNGYNTRSDYLAGKIPVGPICNPSIESIKAAIIPEDSDYYYFVADKNGNTYFTKTYEEHIAKRQKLIDEGIWYIYE